MTNKPSIQVHPKFKEMLHLAASINGKSVVKYTEDLAKKDDPLKEIADQWKDKFNCKTKKKGGYLDMP